MKPVPADTWWRVALAAAHSTEPQLPELDLAALVSATALDAVERATPAERWAGLAAVLMAPHPSHGLRTWRVAGTLRRLLPEVEALFGVPQLSDAAEAIDVGWHQLRVVDEAARAGAPLAVRFAALAHKLGKGGTPRDIWPSHYKHEERAQAVLDTWARRLAVPPDALALARLVVDECDRVHRVSDLRAGPIAQMLQRLDAQGQPERFEQLLWVATCDYAAHAGHQAADYPKAGRLRRALAACMAVPDAGLPADARQQAWAEAVAACLCPQVLPGQGG